MARDQIEESLRTKMSSIKVGTAELRQINPNNIVFKAPLKR
jgi:hypothetical protein